MDICVSSNIFLNLCFAQNIQNHIQQWKELVEVKQMCWVQKDVDRIEPSLRSNLGFTWAPTVRAGVAATLAKGRLQLTVSY